MKFIIIPKKELKPFFEAKWKLAEKEKAETAYKFLNFSGGKLVLDFLRKQDKPTVLDLGCGDGRQTVVFAKEGKAKVTGVDASRQAIERLKARAKIFKLTDRITGKVADILRFRSNKKYDLVCANNVLHYFKDKEIEKIVRKMKSATKRNGLNYIVFELEIEMKLRPGLKMRFANQPERQYKPMEKMLRKLYSDWEILAIGSNRSSVYPTLPRDFPETLKRYLHGPIGSIGLTYNRRFRELAIITKKLHN